MQPEPQRRTATPQPSEATTRPHNNSTFYCKGVFVCAVDRSGGAGGGSASRGGPQQGQGALGAGDGDELLGLCEDLWARGLGDLNENRTQRPSLREALSSLSLRGRVHDISESCSVVQEETACQLLSLAVVSATPLKHSIDNYSGSPHGALRPSLRPQRSASSSGQCTSARRTCGVPRRVP